MPFPRRAGIRQPSGGDGVVLGRRGVRGRAIGVGPGGRGGVVAFAYGSGRLAAAGPGVVGVGVRPAALVELLGAEPVGEVARAGRVALERVLALAVVGGVRGDRLLQPAQRDRPVAAAELLERLQRPLVEA
jgi:hypothetical protein